MVGVLVVGSTVVGEDEEEDDGLDWKRIGLDELDEELDELDEDDEELDEEEEEM